MLHLVFFFHPISPNLELIHFFPSLWLCFFVLILELEGISRLVWILGRPRQYSSHVGTAHLSKAKHACLLNGYLHLFAACTEHIENRLPQNYIRVVLVSLHCIFQSKMFMVMIGICRGRGSAVKLQNDMLPSLD